MTASPPRTERRLAWEWTGGAGLESALVERAATEIEAEGTIVAEVENETTRVTYRLSYDTRWRFRRGAVTVERGGVTKTIALGHHEDGSWSVDGLARPDLAGATDLDVQVTPFTNTSALAQLALRPGETKASAVVYVNVIEGSVSKVGQEYTRLDHDEAPARYRYRNLATGWTGELSVDAEGFVIDYGPWRRRE